jgi:hypothetical protein
MTALTRPKPTAIALYDVEALVREMDGAEFADTLAPIREGQRRSRTALAIITGVFIGLGGALAAHNLMTPLVAAQLLAEEMEQGR